jgi:hypothetical protein
MRWLISAWLLVTGSAWAEDEDGTSNGLESGSAAGSAIAAGAGGDSENGSNGGSAAAFGTGVDNGRPPPSACSSFRGYFEPSLFVAATTSEVGLLGRGALGLQLASCEPSRRQGIALRIGGTGAVRTGRLGFGLDSGIGGTSFWGAYGVELEIDAPIADRRVGVRAGIEGDFGHMVTVGVRWRSDHGMLAVDAFRDTDATYDSSCYPQSPTDIGVMAGLGGDLHLGPGGFAGVLAAGLVGSVIIAVAAGDRPN